MNKFIQITDLVVSRCFYCTDLAVSICHDKRACVLVCRKHEAWRKTTSQIQGHGSACAYATAK